MNRERLQILIDDLRSEHSFSASHMFDYRTMRRETPCGTAGCALGQLPKLWPDVWKWVGDTPRLIISPDDCYSTCTDAAYWFGIQSEDVVMLFYPDSSFCTLSRDASCLVVADHIQKFVDSH